ncbi:phospholipid carrier-dependent glycosyltransferase, partial [Streptomyces sp. NPDC023723]
WTRRRPSRSSSASMAARRRWRLLALGLAAAAGTALIAVAVVWASYLVVDPRLRWTAPADLPTVHGLRAAAAHLLPFPHEYRDGMLLQFSKEEIVRPGFLHGRIYYGGLWYYLPAALLVKTPLGLLALGAAGAVGLCLIRRLRPAVPYVLLPTAVLLATAMTGHRDLGVRYAIFMPFFLAVAAAAVTAVRRWWAHAATAALVAFAGVSSVSTYPYYLPYANEAFGGPAKTHLWLHDSNVDWGQDLGRLADRLRERYPHDKVWLVYKGSGEPSYYGIHAADPLTAARDEVRGLLVVSDSAAATAEAPLAALIGRGRAVDQVGHSITIYRLP